MNITGIEFTTPENEREIMAEYHRSELYRDWYEHHRTWQDYERALFWSRVIGAVRAIFVAAIGVGTMVWLAWGLAR